MSHQQNLIWLEGAKEKFDSLVSERNWEGVHELWRAMEEMGFNTEIIDLSKTLTEEEVESYKKWDKSQDGDSHMQDK